MKNLHVLPTDKPSRLYLWFDKLELSKEFLEVKGNKQHIYITSDEEIKEGDYWLNLDRNTINSVYLYKLANNAPICKKIVLTTDPELIKDGVQAIDDEFLEWFVKNPSCEEVEIEKFEYNPAFDELEDNLNYDGMTSHFTYKIITPKEEPKKERMYSEEDLREAFTQGMENMDYCEMYGWSSKLTEQQWFEQFKNK